jgi:poly-beta-hydroxyalkanoate depolymerase
MWHGATVLLSTLPKTLQAEHIFEISYVQASFLVPVRILLMSCYIDFLLSCMLRLFLNFFGHDFTVLCAIRP